MNHFSTYGSKVQRFKVQRLTDSGCLSSEISGACLRATHRQIEKNREAINPEPLNPDRPNVKFLSDVL
jgi:hypothetical protein